MANKVDAQEAKWQRESDAHTLAEAEQIRADKTRLSGAKKAATEMVKETTKRAAAMKKVASTKVAAKKTTTKVAAKKTTTKSRKK